MSEDYKDEEYNQTKYFESFGAINMHYQVPSIIITADSLTSLENIRKVWILNNYRIPNIVKWG